MKRSVPARAHPVLESERGLCAGGHPAEADAGAAMLAQGGTAVDAAVAAAFAGFVVEQLDCGLGGFARVSIWSPELGGSVSIDGYVRAPAAAHPGMFEVAAAVDTYYGHPPTVGDRARYGPLAVAVPGAVAALCQAHERFGRLPRRAVLEPAIELARRGVAFTWRDALAIAQLADRIRAQPDTAAVLLPGGAVPAIPAQQPPRARMDTSALAATLGRIAEDGAAGFYEGRTAEAIAGHLAARGGILSRRDLERYRAVEERERPGRYRGHELTTCGDHVGYQALGMLDGFDLRRHGPDSFGYRHLMAEALGTSFTDGIAHYGDPDFVASPVDRLRSRAYAEHRRGSLRLGRALQRPIAPGKPWVVDPDAPTPDAEARDWRGTSQMVAADASGMMVSITTAVGWDYGSLVYEPETGVFLNNGMSYFDPRPGRPSSIAPGKRPMFGAPVLVMGRGGGARLACAGSGGYRIQTAVLHATSHVIDFGLDVAEAVDRPRVHCQGRETFVDARIPARTVAALEAAGHQVVTLEDDPSTCHFGRVCLIERDPDTGVLRGSAAPHWLTAVSAP